MLDRTTVEGARAKFLARFSAIPSSGSVVLAVAGEARGKKQAGAKLARFSFAHRCLNAAAVFVSRSEGPAGSRLCLQRRTVCHLLG